MMKWFGRLWAVSTIQLLGTFSYMGSQGYTVSHTLFDQPEVKLSVDGCPTVDTPSGLTCKLDRQNIPGELFRSMRFHVFTSAVEDIIREELDQSSLTYCTKDLAYQNVYKSACPECRFKVKGCRTTPRTYVPIAVTLWADLFSVNESFTPRYLGCAVDIQRGDSSVIRLVARTRPLPMCGQMDNAPTTAAAEIRTLPRPRRRTTTISAYEIEDPVAKPIPGAEGEITDVPERISLTVVIVAGFGAFAGLTFAGLLIFRRISKTDMTAAQDIADYITQSGSLTQQSSSVVSSQKSGASAAAGGGLPPEESVATTVDQPPQGAPATKVADLESSLGADSAAALNPANLESSRGGAESAADLQSSLGAASAAAITAAEAVANNGRGVASSATEFGKKAVPAKVAEPPASAKPKQSEPSKTAAPPSKTAAPPSKPAAPPSKPAAPPSKTAAPPSKLEASPSKTTAPPSKKADSSSKVAAKSSKVAATPSKIAATPSKTEAPKPPPSTKASRTSAKQSASAMSKSGSATAKDSHKQSSQSKKPPK